MAIVIESSCPSAWCWCSLQPEPHPYRAFAKLLWDGLLHGASGWLASDLVPFELALPFVFFATLINVIALRKIHERARYRNVLLFTGAFFLALFGCLFGLLCYLASFAAQS